MKLNLFGRILVILLAALVIVGAALGFAQTGYADALVPTMPAGDAPPAAFDTAGKRPALPEAGPRPEGDAAGGLWGAADIAKNVGILGLMVGLIARTPGGYAVFIAAVHAKAAPTQPVRHAASSPETMSNPQMTARLLCLTGCRDRHGGLSGRVVDEAGRHGGRPLR